MVITNREAPLWVDMRLEFQTGNETIFAEYTGKGLYVVYSYGRHFPMYVYDADAGWIGNSSKYSRTTSKHQTICQPDGVERWYHTDELKDIISAGGLCNYIGKELINA